MGPIERDIHEKLQVLAPLTLELMNESGQHVGHEGAKGGGGHYRLLIVSLHFEGKSRIERHRMVYRALGALMQHSVHALSIEAYTPAEL
ncbi:MAG: BolA family transcriptional regulator [Betaproteobacteria bacterium]|nr:BolA family transcriptional regulator [Betaproteobacteria bacterium]